MKIELKNVIVRELVEGYVDKQEEGVRGYSGKLNIRHFRSKPSPAAASGLRQAFSRRASSLKGALFEPLL